MASSPRRRRVRVVALVAGPVTLAALVVAPPASAAATGTVTGRVVDDTGAAVAGLAVSARTGADTVVGTTTTAADGSYRLTAKTGDRAVCFDGRSVATASGGYSFTCFGGATAATATPVTVTAGAVRKGVSVTVTRRAAITGRATDTAGHPLTGVGIRLTSNGTPVTSTAADGSYRLVFDTAKQPRTSVCFEGATGTGGTSAAGYLDSCGGPFPLTAGSVRTVNRALPAGAGASGRVTDATGAAVANAEVRLFLDAGPTVRTGADGTWRIKGLTPTTQGTLLATPPADAPGPSDTGLLARCFGGSAPEVGTCARARVVTLTAGRVTSGLNVTLPSGGALDGRVTDNAGTPIPGVVVEVSDPSDQDRLYDTQVTSGADGYWRARGLDPGTYNVCTARFADLPTAPDPDGYAPDCLIDGSGRISTFTVGAPDIVVTAALVLTGLGRVVGRVVDAVTGRGVAGVQVAVGGFGTEDQPRVVTGADGSYTVGGVRVGDNGTCAFPTSTVVDPPPLGYADSCPYDVAHLLTPTSTYPVQERGVTTAPLVRLLLNGTVAGRITDSAGFALGGVEVVIGNSTSVETVTATTNARGEFVSPAISPGPVSVCFNDVRGTARRTADGTRPPNGYRSECWNNSDDPTVIPLGAGQRRTGIDAVLVPNPAS